MNLLRSKLCILLLWTTAVDGFIIPPSTIQTSIRSSSPSNTRVDVASARGIGGGNGKEKQQQEETHFLLEEFKTHNGELVNPYNILKVSREADKKEIRQAYIELSRRYHPDGVRHKHVLPGRW